MPVKNIIPGQRVKRQKLERARELRREMTPAEKILWQELRGKPPCPAPSGDLRRASPHFRLQTLKHI